MDVGCSAGFIANYLATCFGEVIEIDIDETAVDLAKRQFDKNNLEFFKINSQKMNLLDNVFDSVICAHIYEHIPDAGSLL